MRTFKFRAYEDGVMYYQVRCGGVFDDIPTAPTVWDEKQGDWSNLTGQPHTLIMQYTGLKDKKGKEVYEGDIVQIKFYFGLVKFKVIFVDGGFYLSSIYEENSGYDRFIYEYKDFGIEVIGNIFENQELINK